VSLRSRLLLGMALVALVLGLAAVVIARATERHLVDQVDDQLRDARPQLRGPYAPGTDDGGRGPEGGQGGPPARLSALYLGRIDAGGELHTVYAPNLRGDDVPLPEVDDGAVAALRVGDAVTVGAVDADDRYRMLAVGDRRAGTVFVAALPLDDVDEAVRRLVAVEVLAVLAIVAMLGLVTWWVMRLGIRPLRHMTETAGAIAAGDLSQRVPEAAPGTEAGDLGVALNGMLGRIEEAFDQRTASEARLRQFIADASHELRTPITTVRGYAELYQAGALREPADLDEAMRRTQQEAERMGSLVEDLLHLARLDQGRPVERTPVDLAALAADAVLDAQAVAPDRTLRTVADGPVVVLGDEARLRQVTANLVGNALVHAPDAAVEVRVSADAEGGAGVLEVVDEGPGMAAEDAARAFERFYRADASRQRHRGGSGLGLAIVEATVRAHGGQVGIETAPGEGTTVRVTLPLAPDA
jgi:two-component system OmpR family sensor kinase